MKEQYSDSLNSAESTNTEVWSTKMRSTSSTSDLGTYGPLLFYRKTTQYIGIDLLNLFLELLLSGNQCGVLGVWKPNVISKVH